MVQNEKYIRASNALCKFMSESVSLKEYYDALIEWLKEWTGCQSVGIQIITGGGQPPYESYQGFSKKLRESVKKPLPKVFSKSAKKNRRTLYLKKERSNITIIPLKYKEKTIAQIYLMDKKAQKLSLEHIGFIGQFLPLISEGIHKFNMEDKMRIAEEEGLTKTQGLINVGKLASMIAHDLRNPLAAINMATCNIRRKKQDLPIDKHLDSIENKISESDKIINNFLVYAQLKVPNYEMINVHNILGECLDLAKKKFPGKELKIVTKLESLKNNFIEADLLQIKELFRNIINNAFDALPSESKNRKVVVGAESGGNESIKISFKDDISSKVKEAGLGLAVCQHIVHLHHGTMVIENLKNKGSSVIVTLPKRKMQKIPLS